ncbi:hypothetical protein MNBD_GAMMA07-596 [hydrothermal vent metagenome]|uniref:STAS domain-containing protein n=1 Tax=hydrothermal vent metagenome TaxID=652676 RepID=A0A3B0XIX2_9ZZZZ
MLKLEQHKSQVKLLGELNFETVAQLLNKSEIDFNCVENKLLKVDLSQVSSFNSASMALLIEWMKLSNQKGVQIKYSGVPEQLTKIAQAYGCSQVLPLTDEFKS